jgi:hypothetical protein
MFSDGRIRQRKLVNLFTAQADISGGSSSRKNYDYDHNATVKANKEN